ncbi:hypothetical protein HYW46_07365 [Candidatus Daviesbacteria bacterium]|nr:hypothetical protein [Candidatus Daviesbacteria bacterium]
MLQDREQYIRWLEERDKSDRLLVAATGGILVGGWVPALGYEQLMHLLGREPQGIEGMAILLVGALAGSTIAFIRERRRQKRELQNQVRNTGPAGRFQ